MIDSVAILPPPETSARGETEALLAGQNLALHLLVTGCPVTEVFNALAATLEVNTGGAAVAGILLLDPDGKRLRHGAAPSLPDYYNQAVDGIEIGADVGTCGAAAFRNEVVITTDIENAPGWARFRHLPLGLGLRAAWSMPIRSASGKVLGTFGTYFRDLRAPTSMERELVALLAKTAGIAIEHRATEDSQRRSESFLKSVIGASPDCIKVLDLDGRLQWMSENGLCAMEVQDFPAIRGTDWLTFWRGESEQRDAKKALSAAQRGETGRFTGFCPTLVGTPKWWDVVLTPMRAGDGAIHAFLSVSREITTLKATEQNLRRTEDELRRALEATEGRIAERTAELAATNTQLRTEIEAREKTERDRQHLLLRLASAEEGERRRISRELHDQVGQQLTALSLTLKLLRPHLIPSGFPALQELQSQVAVVENEVHSLALELRPTALDDLGLASALVQFIDGWSVRTGVAVEYHRAALEAVRFPAAVETAVYRIVQEALTNVGKHAQASRVGIMVEQRAGELLAVVADDGVGFDVAAMSNGRLGVLGMRERAAKCGGTLKLESEKGAGTTVCIRIPLSPTELHG